MNSNALIIDIRKQLPWHRRYASTTSTAMLWLIWLLLWRPIMLLFGFLGVHKPELIAKFFNSFFLVVENGFVALIACAISLCLWRSLSARHPRASAQHLSLNATAQHFHLNHHSLAQARQQKILTLHHDAQGQIILLESATTPAHSKAISTVDAAIEAHPLTV
ncbi:poly-beta-1,6-N-acetyl-D-glucosamine biosynthesis protein PgaD [Acinetobacter larvae]|uniref:Poly-beta-1,6-N-acetyl-D-glucosamine biosynthesis protein PgaD n=1 Tax=Acinetobacter larvae TaxID=1789224 RepID=A0A1B2LWV7_9GAMM|nr:poly-beta-1,6-N-acetyl-D-glucosamine biosynthesis protein PgaD [Acinetobacter larvae]AOA57417.1 poly-beta-1,6-N-acetyl-D-glucosamine biosynthesis protein PgaD [Acinetobacter larvae]